MIGAFCRTQALGSRRVSMLKCLSQMGVSVCTDAECKVAEAGGSQSCLGYKVSSR